MKCFMVELFSTYKARENYTQTISHIIFDEALINPKTGEEYLENEKDKIDELLGSAWRDRDNDPKPKLIYIANPYDRFIYFLEDFLPTIRKSREQLKKKVINNDLVKLPANHKTLYLYKNTNCLKSCSCELENCLELWNNFFAREEDLKMCEFINGSTPKYIFQDCILYQAKKGFLFFISKDNKEISNKEEIKNIPEYYTENEQRRDSKAKYKIPIEEPILKEDLLYY
ncbi:9049_t:CDS:1 [Ambispora leptoticha]|uniref:9049_t:CDS:1 n=1 Tax=Ambispora leptoticha TaxID=144679 RepID=A0A9N9E9W4_9GLOM|nr:9049_t:CDS:1 [Ambispora leptoticha]